MCSKRVRLSVCLWAWCRAVPSEVQRRSVSQTFAQPRYCNARRHPVVNGGTEHAHAGAYRGNGFVS